MLKDVKYRYLVEIQLAERHYNIFISFFSIFEPMPGIFTLYRTRLQQFFNAGL